MEGAIGVAASVVTAPDEREICERKDEMRREGQREERGKRKEGIDSTDENRRT